VDLLVHEDTVDALGRAGCEEVWVGAESGSQKVLDAMDKGTTVAQIYEARRRLGAAGIRTAFFLQFGYPGENAGDIKATLTMVKELLPDDIGISVSYPLPGTVFYDRVKAELGTKHNWTDSDDLAMMFRGTFSPAYYRRLHRYVHKTFRLRKGLELLADVLRANVSLGRSQLRSIMLTAYFAPAALVDRFRLLLLEGQS
jgi:anaerobic magnesium-protoporphyrin IX monomethyl ester cyclase